MHGRAGPEVFGDPPSGSLVRVKRKINNFPASARTLEAGPFFDISTFDEDELFRCYHRPVWQGWRTRRQDIETQQMYPSKKPCDSVFHISSPHPEMVARPRGQASLPGCNKGSPVAFRRKVCVRLGRESAACGWATYPSLRQAQLPQPTTR